MKTRLLAAMRAAVCAVLFALLALPDARATDNNFPTPGGGTADGKVLMCVNSSGQAVPCGNSTTPVQIGGTFSATLSGFTPGGTFATITASATSGSVALPAGTVVAFQNAGSATVSCTLGIGSATATANEIQVPASSTVFVTVGSNTFGACIDQTGSASNLVVLAGGSGLGTGFGGGGGGSGGGTVAQGNAGSNAQAWWAQLGDTTNGPVAVKAASTAPVATDKALVATLSPNGNQATSANQTNKTQFTQLTDGTNPATTYTAYGTAPTGNVPGFNAFVTNSNANGAAAASASSPVTPSNLPVGGANFANTQVSVGSTATQILAARTGVSGTGRISATVCNTSTVAVYLGGSGVTTSTGQYLAGVAGACATFDTTAAIYGIVATGTETVGATEVY